MRLVIPVFEKHLWKNFVDYCERTVENWSESNVSKRKRCLKLVVKKFCVPRLLQFVDYLERVQETKLYLPFANLSVVCPCFPKEGLKEPKELELEKCYELVKNDLEAADITKRVRMFYLTKQNINMIFPCTKRKQTFEIPKKKKRRKVE